MLLHSHIQMMRQCKKKAKTIGVLSTENEDVRSLREMVVYGLKGMAAYSEHALNGEKKIWKFTVLYMKLYI